MLNQTHFPISLNNVKIFSFFSNRNPNIGSQVTKRWEPYVNNKAYLVLDRSLVERKPEKIDNHRSTTRAITTSSSSSPSSYNGIRDDLYNFWFVELDKNGHCSSFQPTSPYSRLTAKYESSRHTGGRDPGMDRCLAELDQSKEYNYLREMFLIEYEYCINMGVHPERLRPLFNTVCLDIIAIRRMLIEYDLCCINSRGIPNITSTICAFTNFNTKFINFKLNDLINYVIASSSSGIPLDINEFLNKTFKTPNSSSSRYLSSITLLVISWLFIICFQTV